MAIEIVKIICITIVALAVIFAVLVIATGRRNDGKK